MGVAAREHQTTGADLVRLHRAAGANPAQPQIWRQLADALDAAGDRAGAALLIMDHHRRFVDFVAALSREHPALFRTAGAS